MFTDYSTVFSRVATEELVFKRTGRLKMRDRKMRNGQKCRGGKMQDWKMRHQTAMVENAGLENAGPICRGGKCGTIEYGKLVCE